MQKKLELECVKILLAAGLRPYPLGVHTPSRSKREGDEKLYVLVTETHLREQLVQTG